MIFRTTISSDQPGSSNVVHSSTNQRNGVMYFSTEGIDSVKKMFPEATAYPNVLGAYLIPTSVFCASASTVAPSSSVSNQASTAATVVAAAKFDVKKPTPTFTIISQVLKVDGKPSASMPTDDEVHQIDIVERHTPSELNGYMTAKHFVYQYQNQERNGVHTLTMQFDVGLRHADRMSTQQIDATYVNDKKHGVVKITDTFASNRDDGMITRISTETWENGVHQTTDSVIKQFSDGTEERTTFMPTAHTSGIKSMSIRANFSTNDKAEGPGYRQIVFNNGKIVMQKGQFNAGVFTVEP